MEEQPHLSIGEVLSLLQEEFPDVTISKIRFLESQGLLDPDRTPSGYRKFYDADISRLRWILRQQREHFLPLKVIKERLEEWGGEIPSEEEVGYIHLEISESDSQVPGEFEEGESPDGSNAQSSRSSRFDADELPADGGHDAARDSVREEAEAQGSSELPMTDVTMTRDELSRASRLTERDIVDAEQYGLIVPRSIGGVSYFDGDALITARVIRSFLDEGLEPRHLKRFLSAAQAEAGIYEQALMPGLHQRHADQREAAKARLRRIVELGDQLRFQLIREVLRDHLS